MMSIIFRSIILMSITNTVLKNATLYYIAFYGIEEFEEEIHI